MNKVLTIVAAACALAGCGGDAPEVRDAHVTENLVADLPLKRGFYVASDTACGQASNATLLLVRRGGIYGSRDSCNFRTIERTGLTSYRVTEECADFQAGPESTSMSISEWEIPDDTSFSSTSDAGWQRNARYCDQSSLPDPWRDSDLHDLVDAPLDEANRSTDPAMLENQ